MIIEYGSLFSGIEGLGLGLEQSGPFRARWQAESRAWCRQVLALRFPHSQLFKDVRDVNETTARRVPLIVSGFPCQDISGAGKRAGIKRTTRSGLWFELARVIRELRPALVFLENGDEITAPIRERGTRRIVDRAPGFTVLASLAEMGFDAQWGVVGAAHVGAPHQRDRWWCIAWNASNAHSFRQYEPPAIQEHPYYAQQYSAPHRRERQTILHETVAGDQSDISNAISQRLERPSPKPRSFETEIATIDFNRGDGYPPDESNMGRIVFDGFSARLERCARTQHWAAPLGAMPYSYEPDRLTLDDFDWKDRVEALGNSICVPVAQAFGEGIYRAFEALIG